MKDGMLDTSATIDVNQAKWSFEVFQVLRYLKQRIVITKWTIRINILRNTIMIALLTNILLSYGWLIWLLNIEYKILISQDNIKIISPAIIKFNAIFALYAVLFVRFISAFSLKNFANPWYEFVKSYLQ